MVQRAERHKMKDADRRRPKSNKTTTCRRPKRNPQNPILRPKPNPTPKTQSQNHLTSCDDVKTFWVPRPGIRAQCSQGSDRSVLVSLSLGCLSLGTLEDCQNVQFPLGFVPGATTLRLGSNLSLVLGPKPNERGCCDAARTNSICDPFLGFPIALCVDVRFGK